MKKLTISTTDSNGEIATQREDMSVKEALFLSCAFVIATAKEFGINEEQLNEAMASLWDDEELENVKK